MLGMKEPIACLPMQTGGKGSILSAQKQMHRPLHTFKKSSKLGPSHHYNGLLYLSFEDPRFFSRILPHCKYFSITNFFLSYDHHRSVVRELNILEIKL